MTLLLASWAFATPGAAQTDVGGWGEVFAGGELERYLRVLQVSGEAGNYPWAIRSLSPREVRRIVETDERGPWAGRYRLVPAGDTPFYWEPLGIAAMTVFNSAFPFGSNDGPMWAGRGLSGSISAGAAATWGPATLVVAPVLWWSSNSPLPLARHEFTDSFPYSDHQNPEVIDLPQRFGEGTVARMHPGQTTLRLEGGGLVAGISTATQVWGPGREYPLILGNNAAGFIHGFAGTAAPVDLWIGRGHGRLMWGQLDQSSLSPVPADSATRFTTGIVATFSPRGVPGLEIGGSRFFHIPWPETGFGRTQLLAPIETFVKEDLLDRNRQELEASAIANQIASIFLRWVFPGSGVEVFGELASDDHRHNLRDLTLEPDHATAYTLGLTKVWPRGAADRLALRAELVNSAASHLHRARRQEPYYIHASTRQGHTHRGQLLGAPAAYGGGGATVGLDYYHSNGRFTVEWQRQARGELNQYLETGVPDRPDVLNGIAVESRFFAGRWDLLAGVRGIYESNRDFERSASNVNVTIGARASL